MCATVFAIAFSLFLLMDAIGNIPLFVSFLKKVPEKRQRKVIARELCIALLVIILFAFLGDGLMQFLCVKSDTIQIAGGLILFLLCLKMIFPPPHDETDHLPRDTEPFVVPLAVPLIAGPSVLAAVMIYSRQESVWIVLGAILLAWAASLLILLASTKLQRLLGWRGLIAMERLMGLLLLLIAVQMFLNGLGFFLQSCTKPSSATTALTILDGKVP
jgi:multiple antibiotic resistance protein